MSVGSLAGQFQFWLIQTELEDGKVPFELWKVRLIIRAPVAEISDPRMYQQLIWKQKRRTPNPKEQKQKQKPAVKTDEQFEQEQMIRKKFRDIP